MIKKVRMYVTILLMILFIGEFTIGRDNIDIDIPAIRYTIGEEEFEPIDITIIGRVNKRLLREDEILYKIYINGENVLINYSDKLIVPGQLIKKVFSVEDFKEYEDPMIYSIISDEVHDGKKFKTIGIEYPYIESGRIKTAYYGELYYNNNFENVIIALYEDDSWSSSNGYEIIVSKDNVESAKALGMEMMRMTIGN